MFDFTLTVTKISTGRVVHIQEYKGYSNTDMMDEQKHLYQFYWPRDEYVINW